MRVVAILAILAAGCGPSGPVAQTSTGVTTDKPEAPGTPGTSIARRHAPVPPANPAERIVFARAGSIWIMNADGSEPAQLTVRSHQAADENPALSPDGTRVAYSSRTKDGRYVIQVMSLEELLPRAITSGEDGGDTNPAWSPDGTTIAFTRGDPRDTRDLYTVPADGSAPPTLHLAGDDEEPDYAGTPTWSPDGRRLIIAADRRQGRGTTLWRVDLATNKLTPLTEARAGGWFVRDQDPAFAPDGSVIAFASNRHATSADHAEDYEIYTVRPDGSGLTRLTEDPGRATDPAFSADGKRLYFVSNRLGGSSFEREIFVMNAGGGVQLRLTRDDSPQNSAPHAARSK